MTPKVSVIVPNYNHAPFLEQRIDSILNQDFQDFELILIDDGSTDSSRAIVESYRSNPHVSHIVFNESNSGSAFLQWTNGIALARGEWVWMAESDDYAEPAFLERLLAEAAIVPGCTLAYAATWWVDEEDKHLWDTPLSNDTHIYSGPDFVRRKLTANNAIANVSECIFRRNAYRPGEAWRYNRMRLCGDWFFYLLLAEVGSVVELCQPLSYYRQHETNISSDAERRGLTFLEGIDVLEYARDRFHLKASDYSRSWGRQWAKYERLYGYSAEVNRAIRRRLAGRHPRIFFFYLIYKKIYKNQSHGNNQPLN